MKKLAKAIVVAVLGWQVRRLRKKRTFQLVAVAGSIGKTSTKRAIAQTLQQKYQVRYQEGNYNDIVTVPLIFFGLPEPSLLNPLAWLWTFLKIEGQLWRPYPYEVVVAEVGTDFPGNLAQFKKYLHADLGVLTAVAPEHMEFFKDLDQVAAEELTLAQLADKLVVNKDLVAANYLEGIAVDATYGEAELADYRIDADGQFTVTCQGKALVKALPVPHGPQRYSLAAATAVAHLLGLSNEQITAGLKAIQPMSGRGRRLAGINNSVIIDDTYNASPEAAKAALQMLYQEKAPQKIAILGSMNELGKYSRAAHEEVGNYCDPKQVDVVVTIGQEAQVHLLPAAQAKGCQGVGFLNPYEAAQHLRPLIKTGAVILAKGSQNGVFAEEAVKLLLADPAAADQLVRQSKYWLNIKKQQFGPIPEEAK